jgi:hypothetical protein
MCRPTGLCLFWPIAPRHQLKRQKRQGGQLIPIHRATFKKNRRYHAYVVPVQKSLRKFRRLATFWCYLTGSEQGKMCETSDERVWVVGWGETSDILLGNVLENHIYEEEMESRRWM